MAGNVERAHAASCIGAEGVRIDMCGLRSGGGVGKSCGPDGGEAGRNPPGRPTMGVQPTMEV